MSIINPSNSILASREKESSILTKGDKKKYSLKNVVKQQAWKSLVVNHTSCHTRKFQVDDDDPSA